MVCTAIGQSSKRESRGERIGQQIISNRKRRFRALHRFEGTRYSSHSSLFSRIKRKREGISGLLGQASALRPKFRNPFLRRHFDSIRLSAPRMSSQILILSTMHAITGVVPDRIHTCVSS